jgi:hypothetical protein
MILDLLIVIDDMAHEDEVTAKEWEELFRENTQRLNLTPECPELWVAKARLMMLDDHPEDHEPSGLDEIERCILHALKLDPEHLEALEEAAHFYDVVIPDRGKATMYAQHYIQVAGRVVDDMQAIIDDSN